jgi:hypothetical protein
MAAKGLFMVFSLSQIESIRDSAFEQLKSGKTIMEYADSGTSVTKGFPLEIDKVLIECRYALQMKAPDQYGTYDRVRVGNMLNNFRGL